MAEPVLEDLRLLIEERLSRALPQESSWPATIHKAVRYSLFAGGKRIRPLLVMGGAASVGGDREEALPLALAVEMIHTYSLIHDDLPSMDNDDLRRGKPTSHKVFGEAVAILAGDALLTRAFHLLAEVPPDFDARQLERRVRATRILGSAAGTEGLIGGQVEDLACEGKSVDGRTLERLHRAKTGALISACVQGGGALGGADPSQMAALTRYGDAIGLAFQIVDDVLDATEGAAQLGKTAGKDASAGKATYVALYGIEASRRMSADLHARALEAIAPFREQGALLRKLAWAIVERRG